MTAAAAALLGPALGGCRNETARAPNPTGYSWPDSFAYRVEYVAQTDRDTEPVARYDEEKQLRFAARNDLYLVWNDSVTKLTSMPGSPPAPAPLWPEDTLQYYVKLGRLGDIDSSEPGCDPAVPACKAALPSALPLELRHIIPRLPVWWPPKGYEWVDTLAFDDLPRVRGSRGSLVTYYRAARDTVLAGRAYWIVTWSSVKRAYGDASSGVVTAEPPVEENGAAYVDKQRLLPAYAAWFGALAAPPQLRAVGVTGTGFRGRAFLIGSAFDSLRAAAR
jgi:hypothetical protein